MRGRAHGNLARLSRHALMENHSCRPTGITLSADKGYDTRVFVNELRAMNVRSHIIQNTNGRRSPINANRAPCRIRNSQRIQ